MNEPLLAAIIIDLLSWALFHWVAYALRRNKEYCSQVEGWELMTPPCPLLRDLHVHPLQLLECPVLPRCQAGDEHSPRVCAHKSFMAAKGPCEIQILTAMYAKCLVQQRLLIKCNLVYFLRILYTWIAQQWWWKKYDDSISDSETGLLRLGRWWGKTPKWPLYCTTLSTG